MEFVEVIKNRRAVRDHLDRVTDRTAIERLIADAILAPSAMNLQPWSFAVILGRERSEGYAKRAKDWLLASAFRKHPMTPHPDTCSKTRASPYFIAPRRLSSASPNLPARRPRKTAVLQPET